jgi:hypothetical protein
LAIIQAMFDCLLQPRQLADETKRLRSHIQAERNGRRSSSTGMTMAAMAAKMIATNMARRVHPCPDMESGWLRTAAARVWDELVEVQPELLMLVAGPGLMPLTWDFSVRWFASFSSAGRRLTEQRRNRGARMSRLVIARPMIRHWISGDSLEDGETVRHGYDHLKLAQ